MTSAKTITILTLVCGMLQQLLRIMKFFSKSTLFLYCINIEQICHHAQIKTIGDLRTGLFEQAS